MPRFKPPKKKAENWTKLIYLDDDNNQCVDLTVDGEKRRYLVQDLVSLVYHGPMPASNSVSHVIDKTKPCTPDNVGWLTSNNWDGEQPSTEIKRPLKKAPFKRKWADLFYLNSEGKLYLPGWFNDECQDFLIENYLSKNYKGPWRYQEGYAYVIDLSKEPGVSNVGWMNQNPDYRTVKYG